ncbi:MAG: hypothetical protein IK130_08555 [Oscillospiraceae bacterium]|nr:hypothetical protein [Oscillospiraceae bacterium]
MGLFGGYQNPGPGINPYAPKKKPFARYWEILWRNFGKLIYLNLIFTLFHLPLLGAAIVYMSTDNGLTNIVAVIMLVIQFLLEGPTLAGTTRVLRLIVLDKAFFMGEEFKKGFTRNLGASFLIWVIDAIMIASVYTGFFIYPELEQKTGTKAVYIPYVISIAVAVILLFMNYYLMPLTVVTKLKKSQVFKNSFMLTALSPKQCLLSLFTIALRLALVVFLFCLSSYFTFFFAFYPAAFIGYTVMFIHYPVIQKFVIDPYYEETGEKNPEKEEIPEEEEHVFTDRSSSETPVPKQQRPKRGKIIS